MIKMLKYYLFGILLLITISCKPQNKNYVIVQNIPQYHENHIENDWFSINLPEKYFIRKTQGIDGVIYYLESNIDGIERIHGEIFFGFFPGTVEDYYSKKIETISAIILGQNIELEIFYEEAIYSSGDVYSTIIIIPLLDRIEFQEYIRIIGAEDNKEDLYKLINSFSTLILKK
jgi:hypothetical protein